MIGVELVKERNNKEPVREVSHGFASEGLKRGLIFDEA